MVELEKNYGFAKGNNIGARKAKGDFLVFLNPDTIVDPNWLSNLIDVFETNASVGIGQPKLLNIDGTIIDAYHTNGKFEGHQNLEVQDFINWFYDSEYCIDYSSHLL